MLRRYWAVALTVLLAGAGAMAKAGVEGPQAAYKLNIGSQPMDDALNEFARQSGLQVILQTEEVKGITAPRLEGTFSARDALGRLLENSGLEFEYLNDRTVAVRLKGAGLGKVSASNVYEGRAGDSLRVAQGSASGASNEPGRSAAEGQNPSKSEEEGAKLDEIVVTAQKREERLQDVPVPVTAISASTLIDSNQLRIQDYYNRVPGLNLTSDGYGTPQIAIRGLTTGTFTNPTVGVVIDDVPVGPTSYSVFGEVVPEVDPNDLARVEVLRGPQGTLYGASSLGGLLKFVTVDPAIDRLAGSVRAGLNTVENGAGVGYSVHGSINVPLSDTGAIRASAYTRRDPGYIDDPAHHVNAVNQQDADGARLSALWRPSSDFAIKLGAVFQSSKVRGSNEVDSSLGDLRQNRVPGSGIYDKEIHAYSAMMTGKLGSTDVTALTGYNELSRSASADFTPPFGGLTRDGNPAVGFNGFGVTGTDFKNHIDSRKFTQEIRLSNHMGDRADWLLGAFYNHEDNRLVLDFSAKDFAIGTRAGTWLDGFKPETYTDLALFTNLTFRFTDRFDLQVGGRESRNRQTVSGTCTGPYALLFEGGDPFIQPKSHSEDDAFTYLITPRLKISTDLMLYARLASGYRPGGPNEGAAALGFPSEYDPDKTQNYELGIKGNVFDHVLSFDASAYYIDWRDIQLTFAVNGGTFSYIGNASRAKSQGLELSMEARPLKGTTVAGWVAFNDAKITEGFPPTSQVPAREGDRLPLSSRVSGNFSVEQRFPLTSGLTGFVAGLMTYVGDRAAAIGASGPRIYPSYTRADLRLGVTSDSWTTNLFVNNIADKRGLLSTGFTGGFVYIEPRMIGLSLSRNF